VVDQFKEDWENIFADRIAKGTLGAFMTSSSGIVKGKKSDVQMERMADDDLNPDCLNQPP
jgi:hypothetical protein